MKNRFIKSIENTDHIYYNVDIIRQEGQESIPATFSLNLTNSIMDTPEDYYMTVARFNIDGGVLPLFIFPIESGEAQTDPDKSSLTVTLRHVPTNTYYLQELIYTPDNIIPKPRPPSANKPLFNQTKSDYYYVYSYHLLLEMVNTAISSALTTLKGSHVVPQTVAPELIYNAETQLFSIIVERLFITNPDVEVYFNNDLASYFNSFRLKFFGQNLLNGADFQFIFKDDPFLSNFYDPYGIIPPAPVAFGNPPTPPNYSIFNQEYTTTRSMHSLEKIIFTTQALPVVQEYFRTAESLLSDSPDGGTSSISIMTDFSPDVEAPGSPRSHFVYNPTAQYRLIDLKGNVEQKRINLQLFWSDNKNNIYPFFINSQGKISVKLLFVRKDLYRKNNNIVNDLRNIHNL